MVVIGGQVANKDSSSIPDPFPEGVGVFNLSALQWSSSYDPSAPHYVTPQVVKTYIKYNGRYPKSWDHPTVKGWFTGYQSSTAPTKSHISNSNNTDHSSNTGGIAGSIVGGVVGAALIVLLVYVMVRRHRRSNRSRQNADIQPGNAELDPETAVHEISGIGRLVEMDDSRRYELGAGWLGHEMPGKQVSIQRVD